MKMGTNTVKSTKTASNEAVFVSSIVFIPGVATRKTWNIFMKPISKLL
jgi:hypothetical protein